MFRKLFFTCFVTVFVFGCNEKKVVPDSDIDAARTFIKNIQDNDFSLAGEIILPDDENKSALLKLKKDAASKSTSELEKYKNADNNNHNNNDSDDHNKPVKASAATKRKRDEKPSTNNDNNSTKDEKSNKYP